MGGIEILETIIEKGTSNQLKKDCWPVTLGLICSFPFYAFYLSIFDILDNSSGFASTPEERLRRYDAAIGANRSGSSLVLSSDKLLTLE